MTSDIHERLMNGFSDLLRTEAWDRMGDYFHADAVLEFPQSGERFRGLENIRAQFEQYPDIDPDSSELEEVMGETKTYALTPSYTVVGVEGTGNRGTAIVRVRYPDATNWFAINVYELRDDRFARVRTFFAPFFDPPDWRAQFREAP